MARIGLIQVCLVIGLVYFGEARREETLDPNGNYVVGWEVDFDRSSVTFDVTVRTIGYVGFGISNGGGMLGADIMIGGLHPNGTAYFGDFHALGEFGPILDDEQNWVLHSATENSTHTLLTFSRLLNTGDEQDTAITNDPTNFIWSFGPTDRILYHGPNRGSTAVNVLDPSMLI